MDAIYLILQLIAGYSEEVERDVGQSETVKSQTTTRSDIDVSCNRLQPVQSFATFRLHSNRG